MNNLFTAALGVQLINGKIKPKFGAVAIFGVAFMTIFVIGFSVWLVIGVLNLNIEAILFSIIGIISFTYLLLISPYTQKSSNYYIEFQYTNSLAGFRLYYKQKLVDIRYVVDNTGRIAFADNMNKLNCVSYADKTKMGNFTKYRIINYFSKWLNDNNLLSNDVTVSFEKL